MSPPGTADTMEVLARVDLDANECDVWLNGAVVAWYEAATDPRQL